MAAERKFTHKGVTVLVYRQSIKLTGMHDVLYLGHEPKDEQIVRMIDAIQEAAAPAHSLKTQQALTAALELAINTIAFINRDIGTERLAITLGNLVKDAQVADQRIRGAMAGHQIRFGNGNAVKSKATYHKPISEITGRHAREKIVRRQPWPDRLLRWLSGL